MNRQENLMQILMDNTGVNINLCYQCQKCSAGCPMNYTMDYTPAQLIHAIRLGMTDLVLNSKTMWLCASCQTCTTRCPQEVDIARIMDACKIMAVKKHIRPSVSSVYKFNKAGLRNIKWLGRLYELGLIADLKMQTFEFFKDMGLGIKMFRKGKLKILPSISPARAFSSWKIFSRVKKTEDRGQRTEDRR